MDPVARSSLDAVLPMLIGGFMAAGSLVGFAAASPTLLQEGPSGDMAGAAGALTMILAGGAGVVSSAIGTVVARARGRGVPQRVVLRCGLSLLNGVAVGAIASAQSDVAQAMVWLLLLGAPVAIAWCWRTPLSSRPPSDSAAPQA